MRTPEQVREHYEIEKELANRLRNASKEERRYLYNALYDELYQRVPHHPQLAFKKDFESRRTAVSAQMNLLGQFLNPSCAFLELGCGNCSLSLEVSKHVKKVYAIDVSRELTRNETLPENFELIISDGCSIPVPEDSVDVVYSNQLMEHLHPDDALQQIQNIRNVMTEGGVYICITPNRLRGPHDISKHFDKVATGFHLKEYTFTELCKLFRKGGFSRVRGYICSQGRYLKFPILPIIMWEQLLSMLPFSLRTRIGRTRLFRMFLGIIIMGIK